MKMIADLAVLELIDKDEEEKDRLLTVTCEDLDTADVMLIFSDGAKYKVDGSELMDAIARVSCEWPCKKSE